MSFFMRPCVSRRVLRWLVSESEKGTRRLRKTRAAFALLLGAVCLGAVASVASGAMLIATDGTPATGTTVFVSNAPPVVAAGENAGTYQGHTFTVAATFTDPGVEDVHTATVDWDDGSPREAAVVAELGGSGSIEATHVYVEQGVYSVTFRVSDGMYTVSDQLQVPVGDPDSYTVYEHEVLTVAAPGVLGNDTDPDGDPLTAVLVSESSMGTLTFQADGSFTYEPEDGYNTPTDGYPGGFTYCAFDGESYSDPVYVEIDVLPRWASIIAYDQAYYTDMGTNIDGMLNAVSPDAGLWDHLYFDMRGSLSPQSGMVLQFSGQPTFTYVPNPGFTGYDASSYSASDLLHGSAEGYVSFAVGVPLLHLPVATTDSYAATYETKLVVDAVSGVLTNDTDSDGDMLSAVQFLRYGVGHEPDHGTLSLDPDGSFEYVPDAGFTGTDTFSYRASDGLLRSDVVDVEIEVAPTGGLTPPVATDDSYLTGGAATFTVSAVSGVLANDTDADGDALSVTLTSDVTHGTLALNSDGSFAYGLEPGYAGTDTFDYEVTDGVLTDSGTVTIEVLAPPNTPPMSTDDVYATEEDTFLAVDAETGVLANDVDAEGNPLVASVKNAPDHGTLALDPDGSLTYAPDTDYNGIDTFTYTASDGLSSDTATVTIAVGNTPPVAVAGGPYVGTEGAPLQLDGAGSFDPDAPADSIAAYEWDIDCPSFFDDQFGVTPTVWCADNGIYEVSLLVTDEGGLTDEDTATVIVLNADPVIDSFFDVFTDLGYETTITAEFSDTGVADTHTATVDWGDGSLIEPGTVAEADGAGTVEASHVYAAPGSYNATVTVTDDDGASAIETATVTIVANSAPVAVDDTYETNEDTILTVAAPGVLENDSDADGDELIASPIEDTAHGVRTLEPDGSFIYTPDPDWCGTDTFTYWNFDGNLYSDPATVTITVLPVDDPPNADAGGPYAISQGGTLSLDGSGSSDPDEGCGDSIDEYAWEIDGDFDFDDAYGITIDVPDGLWRVDSFFDVWLRVTDTTGRSDTDSATVTVTNVAPTLAPLPDIETFEGDEITITVEFGDAGREDTHTVTIDWGDGTEVEQFEPVRPSEATSGTLEAAHEYGDDGEYEATVTVEDDEGATAEETFTAATYNRSPVLGFTVPVGGSGTGGTYDSAWCTCSGGNLNIEIVTFRDPGNDTHMAYVTWGDGTAREPAVVTSQPGGSVVGTITAGHAYADTDTYTVTVEIYDDDGGYDSGTFDVVCENVAPVVVMDEDEYSADEGSELDVSGVFGDVGLLDTHEAMVDWGDGGPPEPAEVVRPGAETTGTLTGRHVYADEGTYTATVTVTDDDGGVGTDTFKVFVANVAPTIEYFGPGSDPFEGQVASVEATFTDPGVEDTHTATIDWGDGSPVQDAHLVEPNSPDGSVDATHTYADNGTYTVTLTVQDDDDGIDTETLMVTVTNVAPELDAGPDREADEGELVPIIPSFVDPGILDKHTGTVDWGDGSAIQPVKVTEPNSPEGSLEASHTYADDGVYVVTFTVEDEDGGIDTDTVTVTVDNVAPSVSSVALSDTTPKTGQLLQASVTFTDPGVLDTHTAIWNWGDGTTSAGIVSEAGGSGSVAGSHIYATGGTYTAKCTVTDEDGDTGTSSKPVTVEADTPPPVEPTEKTVVPIAGTDRYRTAVEASQESYPTGAATVVIATGVNWPDALGGSALAGAVEGPLLLTKPGELPSAVVSEITRLGATNAYILGGTAAVSQAVEDGLNAKLSGTVTRIAGPNRYGTANLVADAVIRLQGSKFAGGAYIATGDNFPDALGASPLAASSGTPILLTKTGGTPYLPSKVDSAVILGGEAAVTPVTEAAVRTALGTAKVTRVGGTDRYDTAAKVADYGVAHGMHWDGVGIATGLEFPDALSGGAMLGQMDSVLLLTKQASLVSAARQRITSHKDDIDTVYFIGGTAAVNQSVRDEVAKLIE